MGRLHNDVNFGYVPTAGIALAQLAAMFQRQANGIIRVADVGCGAGNCLAALAAAVKSQESYGVEVEASRAKLAATILTCVLHEDAMQTVLAEGVISLLNLNPPYQDAIHAEEENAIRVEHQWLARFWRILQRPDKAGDGGGVLIYTVSRRNLVWQSCRLLARNFGILGVFEYAESLYDQVFIVGRRKYQPCDEPEQEIFLNLVRTKALTASIKENAGKALIAPERLAELLTNAVQLAKPHGVIFVPCVVNPQPFRWMSEKPHMVEVETRLRESPMWERLRSKLYFPPLTEKIKMIMSPEVGHLVPILEAQDAVLLCDVDGKNPILVKMFGDRQTLRWEETTEEKSEVHVKNPPISVLCAWTAQGDQVEFR